MTPETPSGGRRRKQLRVAIEGVRRGRPRVHDRDGDQELLELVTEPYSSVEEAHRRLEELQAAFEAREDRRVIFLSIYSRMTGAVADRITRGEFHDPEWVSKYLVSFANLYREAVHTYEADNLHALADPWQLAFDAAKTGDSLVVQDAALGVNAHINYDLALALEEIDLDSDSARRYEDHSTVTDVIRDLIDETQQSLAVRNAPSIQAVDETLGSLDDRFLVFTIDECRDSAWRTAQALRSRFRMRRKVAYWFNDITSTGAAYLILASQVNDRLHDTLREIESS